MYYILFENSVNWLLSTALWRKVRNVCQSYSFSRPCRHIQSWNSPSSTWLICLSANTTFIWTNEFIVVRFNSGDKTVTKVTVVTAGDDGKLLLCVLSCKAKRQYLLTLQVGRYCLLALHSSVVTPYVIITNWPNLRICQWLFSGLSIYYN